jgi:predicted nucleic acid-binding protein
MPSRPRIYLDSCCYVDVAKGADKVKAEAPGREGHIWWIETLITAAISTDIEIVASTMVIAECLHVGDGANIPEDAKETFRRLLTSGQIILVAPDIFIVERARDLRWVDGINCGGGTDGVHVATALENGCQEFLTTNTGKGPAKPDSINRLAAKGLRVIPPPLTSVLPDKYRQPLLADPQ